MEALVTVVSLIMAPAMVLWLVAGLAFLAKDVLALNRDEQGLEALKSIAKDAQGSNYETKMVIRMNLVKWAEENPHATMARWIFTVHNAVYAGGQGDPAALADAIWSQERERHYWFRFFSRNAIQVGLFFTSVGLCDTLARVAPALTAKATNQNDWVQAVQTAMSHALGGMSAAFYSSLAGLFISLFLSLLANILLTGKHEAYLHRLDSFLQGSLIPIFSSIVEKDRNDLIRDMLSRTEEAFDGIRQQFQTLVEQNQAQYKDLAEFRNSLAGTVVALDKQLGGFGKGVDTLSQSSNRLVGATEGIGQALDSGLKQLAAGHAQTIALQQDLHDKVILPFTETVSKQAETNATNHHTVLMGLSAVSERFETLTTTLSAQLEQDRTAWETRQSQLQAANEALGGIAQQHVTQSQVFYRSWEKMAGDQQEALKEAASAQQTVLEQVSQIVNNFSLAGEALERQLADIYLLHQQEVSKLYQTIGGELGSTLQVVVEQASGSLTQSLGKGLEQVIKETHDEVTGLGDALKATADQQGQGVEAMRSLHEAVALNAEGLARELAERRTALEALLEETARGLGETMATQSDRLIQTLGDRLAKELHESLTRQEQIVTNLNQTVGRKWEHLLTAYEAATHRSANA